MPIFFPEKFLGSKNFFPRFYKKQRERVVDIFFIVNFPYNIEFPWINYFLKCKWINTESSIKIEWIADFGKIFLIKV